ncbi:pentapeptide repeat-containing protein [Fuscovulum ytuae]|uniref:Pentapeptide repeat-containing protein n=1 Tax=Fuscovulum ytuae TaxID=3042299 RepID=A0ABY8Q200_9RHOB|nr:pentapeptide repeat-containing protein [Fuscovulum sp. YMD61]WGV14776.1 pentapeptide repeat-containing protein [Fuscovulum sp. YMD61]
MDLHHVTTRLEVDDADLSGSRFNNTNLSETIFTQVTLAGAQISDADMTGCRVSDATLSGAVFANIDLSGVVLKDCRLTGMTIDGVPFEAMVAAWRRSVGG